MKIYLTAGIALLAVSSFSQIPNSGFESWTNMGNYSNPNQWSTLNALTNFDNVYTCIQGTPGNPGASYLMLRTETVAGLGIVPGIAATGTINTTNYSVLGGFSFTQRPQYLTGNWQYMPYAGTDFGYISVYLTKWNTTTNVRDTISATVTSLAGMIMTWSSFSFTLNYQMGSFPDSAQIVISASGTTSPAAGDYLYIDNLAFTGSVAGIENDGIVTDLNLFPNPSCENTTVEFTLLKPEEINIHITDITGRIVKEIHLGRVQRHSKYSVDTKTLKTGTYFLKVITKEGAETKKLIIQ